MIYTRKLPFRFGKVWQTCSSFCIPANISFGDTRFGSYGPLSSAVSVAAAEVLSSPIASCNSALSLVTTARLCRSLGFVSLLGTRKAELSRLMGLWRTRDDDRLSFADWATLELAVSFVSLVARDGYPEPLLKLTEF